MKLRQLVLAGAVSLIACGLAKAGDFGSDGTMKSFSNQSFGDDSMRHGGSGNWGGERWHRWHHHHHSEGDGDHDGDDHHHDHDDNGGVPEPGTWAMLIVGAGLVAYQLRRKQHSLGSRAA